MLYYYLFNKINKLLIICKSRIFKILAYDKLYNCKILLKYFFF